MSSIQPIHHTEPGSIEKEQSFSISKDKRAWKIFAASWIAGAILVLVPVTRLLNGAFPVFTFLMLVLSLIVLLRSRDSSKIGIRRIPWRDFVKYTLINLAGALALMALLEPWSHTYQILVYEAVASSHPDTTFGWLVRFPGIGGWTGFVLYAGFVTLFAEELFFRGWLLQWLKSHLSNGLAIVIQAALFTLPQLLAAILLPPVQGILYAGFYSLLAIGVIGGWSASRTQSIWPSLASAILNNLIMCATTM